MSYTRRIGLPGPLALLLLGCSLAQAGEEPPPLTPPPPAAPSPAPTPASPAATAPASPAPAQHPAPVPPFAAPKAGPAAPGPQPQLLKWIQDLQGPDKALQDAAFKGLLELGGEGFGLLGPLRKSADPELAKRAGELAKAIETRLRALMLNARKLNFELGQKNLTVENLQKIKQAHERLLAYTPSKGQQSSTRSYLAQLDDQIRQVERATQELARLDSELPANPQGLGRARIQLLRGQTLQTLKRAPEVLAAVQDGLLQDEKHQRFRPALLKLKAEQLRAPNQMKEREAVCRQILAECPKSLETRAAHEMLCQLCLAQERCADLVAQLKAYAEGFPLDEKMQETLRTSLDQLFSVIPDFQQAALLAEFMTQTLPPSRLDFLAARALALCNEYVTRDYAKAERGYRLLAELFPEQCQPRALEAALARLKQKKEGTFPSGPQAKDEGPKGAFGRFLEALRKNDREALEEATAEDDFELLEFRIEDVTIETVLSDYVVSAVETDKDGKKATLSVRHFLPEQEKPVEEKIVVLLEAEAWRVHWPDPDFKDEEPLGVGRSTNQEGGFVQPPNLAPPPAPPAPPPPPPAAPEARKDPEKDPHPPQKPGAP